MTNHDLGNHRQYNSRLLPIYEDIYLPANFELIYATGDTSTDSSLNMFIAQYDTNAKSIMKELEGEGAATIEKAKIKLESIKSPLPVSDDPLFLKLKTKTSNYIAPDPLHKGYLLFSGCKRRII